MPLSPCPHLGRRSLSSPEPSESTVAMSADGGGGVEALGRFWQQPDGMGYVRCLNFSEQYLAEGVAAALAGRRRKDLLVVVCRGLNQHRSTSSGVTDESVLADDVKVVSSLPSTHIMTRPVQEKQTPLHLNREGVLLLRGLATRLYLQKLRCKVFSSNPRTGQQARHEEDKQTGCLPGLNPEHDEIVRAERKLKPELLTGTSNMAYHDRKACRAPLNAAEVTRHAHNLCPFSISACNGDATLQIAEITRSADGREDKPAAGAEGVRRAQEPNKQ
ncbi:hypothetical protein GW17_00033974 [Ensete ventricosum]|nr:hypothetical protein GW17_00033974 [Ensete ventricosum]